MDITEDTYSKPQTPIVEEVDYEILLNAIEENTPLTPWEWLFYAHDAGVPIHAFVQVVHNLESVGLIKKVEKFDKNDSLITCYILSTKTYEVRKG